MILHPAKKRRPPEDDSFVGMRVGVLLLVALALFAVLAFRLWFLQILSGDEFVSYAQNNRLREVVVEAPRGVIYDRNEQILLVENRAGLSVGLLPMDMYDPKDEPAQFQQEIAGLADLLEVPEADLLKAYEKATKDPYVTYTVKEDVSENSTVAYLKEHSLEFPGVEVETTSLRQYPYKSFATHLLGYVGEISESDLDQPEFAELEAGAHIGKDGVERTYDSFLRGTDGWKTVEVDAAGRPKKFLEDVAAKPGNNLVLTIDAELQEAAEEAIAEGLQRAHEDPLFRDADAGAVVAMDPRTGEVLALASYPDYDPSLWVGGMSSESYAEVTAEEAGKPLFDRAISGLYPAASTFKVFVAAAALDAGIVSADTILHCDGSFEAAGQKWKCWKDKGHGDLNLIAAIAQSCDVYFYNLGYLLWQQTGAVLQEGVREFGFGKSTGIDLPGETNGTRVPDRLWKQETGQDAEAQAWKPGDEINLAIGQGDLLVTPMQMAVALSALANGGDVWVPHLGLRITDSSGNVIHQFESEKRGELGFSDEILSSIRRGMRLVTSDPSGTAYAVFKDFPKSVAGKTGTAEKKPDADYALFMGYAPANGNSVPEIVVVAIIEQGGHGSSVAAPVVRRVMEAYFHTEAGKIQDVQVTE
jgi:penicillin-binding protein 2